MMATTTLHHLKTTAAARALGVSYAVLYGLLRDGKIDPPPRDSSGDYVWLPGDVERARSALAARGRRTRSGGAGRREGVAS
jgi:hypothetical protein